MCATCDKNNDQRSDRCFCRTATYDPRHRPRFTVECERNASLRAYEVVIVNRKPDGSEGEGLLLYCSDDGKIGFVGKKQELIDGVDMV